jgi:hypothetical protein
MANNVGRVGAPAGHGRLETFAEPDPLGGLILEYYGRAPRANLGF